MSPSEWIVAAVFVVIFLLACYGIRKTNPPPRSCSPRATDYDLASGSWTRYRGDAEHPRASEAVVPQAGKRAA